jgi:choline monooxygenase
MGSVLEVANSTCQLPVSWYFDAQVALREQEALFRQGPRYVGHELMAPNAGDYATVPWTDNGLVLVNNGQNVDLLNNVCRHRQAIMLEGRGNVSSIVCPLHRWTYDLKGSLIGAPHFPEKPCADLGRLKLDSWNGLLFDGSHSVLDELKASPYSKSLDFSGYQLDSIKTARHHFNWKTFIEVYLEDYHVVPFHPGLSGFVNCDDLRWEFGQWYSVQTVGINHALKHPGSGTYQQWHEVVRRYDQGNLPDFGAIWMVIYPNIMVEWYPHVLVVSTVWPDGPEHCTNIMEFYYPEDIVLFERDYVLAQQAAYAETAVEDDEICERMARGRRHLISRGLEDAGPYQSPMEDGMQHFHEFIRRQLG